MGKGHRDGRGKKGSRKEGRKKKRKRDRKKRLKLFNILIGNQ